MKLTDFLRDNDACDESIYFVEECGTLKEVYDKLKCGEYILYLIQYLDKTCKVPLELMDLMEEANKAGEQTHALNLHSDPDAADVAAIKEVLSWEQLEKILAMAGITRYNLTTMNFNILREAVHQQFEKLAQGNLFRTTMDGYDLWDLYLGSFPSGSNPLYKERTEHDCQCCKYFIRSSGNVVGIVDNKIVSIWDIDVKDKCWQYQAVADAMARAVKSKPIDVPFFRKDIVLGTKENLAINPDNNNDVTVWEHFHFELPRKFVTHDVGAKVSEIATRAQVLERSLREISPDTVETVLELIQQNSLYRGQEHKATLEKFLQQAVLFGSLTDEAVQPFIWNNAVDLGYVARIRNSAIGTLLVDLSGGMELDGAVTRFEKVVAPTNYKRPTALITKSMIKKAQEKVAELGLTSALSRRHAVMDDLTINNMLYADRSAKQQMNVFDELAAAVPEDPKKYKRVDTVSVDDFINKVMPTATKIELQVENKHENNLMSLVAPSNADVKRLFKWLNNFSWDYKGGLADSNVKKLVKKHGGNVSGVLRFSIMWNAENQNPNDYDAHCLEPNGNLIHYPKARCIQPSTGMLDVDIIDPGNKPACENIVYTDLKRMPSGKYTFMVHNYSHGGGTNGFTAEVEFDGQIYTFVYKKNIPNGHKVVVAEVEYNKSTGFKIVEKLPSTLATREIWGLSTNNWHLVRTIMNSPNHWDGEQTGNKHLFFILEGCKNPTKPRGFFNEFLRNNLMEHRKVFEVLGGKMRAEVTDEQLSGLGFSSTQRNEVLCRVTGKSTRVIRIKF